MPKVAFYTLGCKVNQYESAAMAELFLKKGYEVISFDEKADVYVINTCDVTSESGRKSRQMIRKAVRKNPDAAIAVTGCYSQLQPRQVANIPGVDVVIGTTDRKSIVDLVEKSIDEKKQVVEVKDIMQQRNFEEIAFKGHRQKTRAFLKIQEGCNMFCAYCIIPYARGPIRSRSIESIIDEAQSLARDGFQEIVLTGIHLGLYGADIGNEKKLIDVITKIKDIEGIKRIRLSSIEVMELTEDFIKRLAEIESFCHHFHIPLQSGSDSVLRRMNRRYTTGEFFETTQFIRKIMPDVSITTDVMVGFPGETSKEFKETVDFIKDVDFSRLHVFPFSARKGTPAAKMQNVVDKSTKRERSSILIDLGEKMEKEFRERFSGRTLEVLFEERMEKDFYEGLTENYIKVWAKSVEDLHNKLLPVRLEQNTQDYIIGKL
jgi:threonylcarbamoyladenosine tRNA methylthiotransferase MtaB